MTAALEWAGSDGEVPAQAFSRPVHSRSRRSQPGELPPEVESALWRGTELGQQAGPVLGSGFEALDRELPGGGWPCRSLTELLCPQPSVLEWRLLGPALRAVVSRGGEVVVIGPPKTPHLPGLRHEGLDDAHLVWIQADAPSERLWCTEQLVKAGTCGAVLAWLPQARPEQIRRLQVCAQACDGPVFLFRPSAAQHEPSAAPLRVLASFGLDWELQLRLLKRRGAAHDGVIQLASIPGGLGSVLTPRLRHPSQLLHVPAKVSTHALGSPVASLAARRHATVR